MELAVCVSFDKAVGSHEVKNGIREGQLLTADLANLHFKAVCGLDLQTNDLKALIDFKVDASTAPPLPIKGPITAVTWPLCNRQVTWSRMRTSSCLETLTVYERFSTPI